MLNFQFNKFRILQSLFILIFPILVIAQPVQNDSIKYRKRLLINEGSTFSKTDQCTVEWKCIDPAQFKGKLTFHNDQWFYFVTADSGDYYINILNQKCREKRGVQVIVIDGAPCIPETYQCLKLHSMRTVENLSYTLNNLKANSEYLICIDGMLGDFCDFEINVTSVPPAYIIKPLATTLKGTATIKLGVVSLLWQIEEGMTDSLLHFKVYKKESGNSPNNIATISITPNTKGDNKTEYSLSDSVSLLTQYTYSIIGESNTGNKYLIQEFNVISKTVERKRKNMFYFNSKFKGQDYINILIYSYYKDDMPLANLYEKNVNKKQYVFDLTKFAESGLSKFKIIIQYRNEKETFIVSLD